MTHDELTTVARTHTVDFPRLSGEPWANQDSLNKVTALAAVAVSFDPNRGHAYQPGVAEGCGALPRVICQKIPQP